MEKFVILKEVFNLLFNDSEEESDNDIRVVRTHFKKCKKYGNSVVAKLPNQNYEQAIRSKNDEDPVTVEVAEKTSEYFIDDIVPEMSDKIFRQRFRVEFDIFEIICKDIYPFLYKKYGPGRNPLNLDKQVMMTLCYLGNKEGLR